MTLFFQKVPALAQTSLQDGTLVRVEGETKLYVIDDGRRRAVDSPETLRIHGLEGAVTVLAAAELVLYPEGENLTASASFILGSETDVLPDLAPFGAGNMHLSTVNGRTALRFSTSFVNFGKGPFEVFTQPSTGSPADGTYHTAYQRIIRKDGVVRNKVVGSLLFHRSHDHYHHADFADYKLEMVRSTAGSLVIAPAMSQKTTFCLRDDMLTFPEIAGAPRQAIYKNCGQLKQGVSVGWSDIYAATLPDQHFDVQDLPAGIYKLTIDVDPRGYFVEGRADNNVSVSLLELDVAKRIVRVFADTAPFANRWNKYEDGMLVRAEGDDDVYVIRDGRKRLLRSDAIVASYGRSSAEAYELPKGVIDAIPRTRVIRLAGSTTVHLVNDTGYRRRILNPEVFASYGFTWSEVAEVNATEFAAYLPNDLIMRVGDNRVFSIEQRKFIGSFASLPSMGRDLASVHLVSDTDFSAYTVSVAAKDLNVPWDIVFLPDGDMLVTERVGTLRRIGKQPAIIDIPSVRHTGEGGLMGMALHPHFANNSFVYLYFTAEDTRKNRIVRFRLDGASLVQDKVIFDGIPSALYHDGGQIAFGPDGMLYVTTGDAEKPELAQDLSSLGGKTLRLTPEGGIPSDNPFGTAVWSYGHRNAQGIAWDGQGRMWQTEHGRSGALSGLDELNLVEKGRNYGWPTIQGDAQAAGMTPPTRHSGETTTWAPSGMAYAGGDLFFAGLRGSTLYQAKIDATGKVTDLTSHFAGVYGRLRAVVIGPEGALYVSTSNRDGRGTPRAGDDKIIKIHPELLR